jgi:hypothetical protein
VWARQAFPGIPVLYVAGNLESSSGGRTRRSEKSLIQ